MNKINFAKELEKIISDIGSSRKDAQDAHIPRLLLHCCCAPCSSYCLMYLLPYFDITCFYYNPNITDEEEYHKRLEELHRLVGIINHLKEEITGCSPSQEGCVFPQIDIMDGRYEPDLFYEEVKRSDLASCPEGGARCSMCFSMRLQKTYEEACRGGYDYFTTTLTISPLKDAQLINRIGYAIASAHPAKGEDGASVLWLPSDFKKNDGYKTSIELSERFSLYRQNYCGCIYSRR